MREVTISRWTAQTASGRRTTPEFTTWGATEMQGEKKNRRTILAVSQDKKNLEKLFPHAHNMVEHHIDRNSGECTTEGCWRNPNGQDPGRH